MKIRHYFLGFIALCCWACQSGPQEKNYEWKDIQEQLQGQLILAKDGDTIRLPEGHFRFSKGLSINDKANLTLIGAGMGKTVLSFKGQEEGAEGIYIGNCRNVLLQDFTVEDAKGDNIKSIDTRGMTFRRIEVRWTGEAKSSNGAYGLYPVTCKRVTIDECVASGASDAGIYVGQTDTVVIKNCKAYHNVAGIESENSRWVQIYGNEAYENTGGILIFDLPGLTQYGHTTKVFDNNVHDNNHENFAPEGNIVGVVPPGTGFMVLATRDLEMTQNKIIDNQTVGIAIISYELVAAMSEKPKDESEIERKGSAQRVNNNFKEDSLYNPYPDNIAIHENEFSNSHWFPTLTTDLGKLFAWKFPFHPPDIVFDGFVNPKNGKINLCIMDNKGDIQFVDMDAPHELDNMKEDMSPYQCKGVRL